MTLVDAPTCHPWSVKTMRVRPPPPPLNRPSVIWTGMMVSSPFPPLLPLPTASLPSSSNVTRVRRAAVDDGAAAVAVAAAVVLPDRSPRRVAMGDSDKNKAPSPPPPLRVPLRIVLVGGGPTGEEKEGARRNVSRAAVSVGEWCCWGGMLCCWGRPDRSAA